MPDDEDEDEIEDLYDDIEDIISCENAGSPTDWSVYPTEIWSLVKFWRNTELEVKALQTARMQIWLKSHFKQE